MGGSSSALTVRDVDMYYGRADLAAIAARFPMLRTANHPSFFRAREDTVVLPLADAVLVVSEPMKLLVRTEDAHYVYAALSSSPRSRLTRNGGTAPADFSTGSFCAKPCVTSAEELASTEVQFYLLG